MSEKPQHTAGVPAEIQPLGGEAAPGLSGPEARPRCDEECATGRSESEQSLSRRVSRETSETTPEQAMLNEIMDRAMSQSQSMPKKKAEQEVPLPDEPDDQPEQETPPSPPEKNKPSSAYIYLAVLFGAAFLMLLLAYFVQQRNNATVLDDLRTTTASREELLEDIKALEEERDQLQKEITYQKDRVAQKNLEVSRAQESLENMVRSHSDRSIQKMSLEYFWYLDHFMDSKEYILASAVILFSADYYRSTWNSQISLNPAQVAQYEAYRQELIDKGYLQQLDHARDGGTDIWFTDQWNPDQSDDVAALCILWLALDYHFVLGNDNGASQYLCLYPLGNPESDYQDRVARLASKFTLEQFQLLKDELIESKWLIMTEDGAMSQGYGPTGFRTDELYTLPFQPPEKFYTNIELSD